jgi:hypothetical protein
LHNTFEESMGIIPRVIRTLFCTIADKEAEEATASQTQFKVRVQFLELYGEDIKDLLDYTKTAKVSIRETAAGELFISGATEQLVSSPEQMMNTLEMGSKFRTTAATRMNQSSSRSHAIFTVILEQSVFPAAAETNADGEPLAEGAQVQAPPPEVRKCKFHFVDLAGSERAKRTGAAGQQLKEGIDINRGLLALGNVISALGDEQKRGKVFVPYRDSKLTRMLQDSLGGNSKTLVICCASPSVLNYNESVNALRYANRARNIQNKPVVNRDPTLVLIDEMKGLLCKLAVEVKEARGLGIVAERGLSNAVLDSLVRASVRIVGEGEGQEQMSSLSTKLSLALGGSGTPMRSTTPVRRAVGARGSRSLSPAPAGLPASFPSLLPGAADNEALKAAVEQQQQQLRARLRDSDFEVERLNEQIKHARQQCSAYGDQLLLLSSERDYYKMRWEGAVTPEQAAEGETAKAESLVSISGYLREIEGLKRHLATEKLKAEAAASLGVDSFDKDLASAENEFTSSIARVIAQTREQLERETRMLASRSPRKGSADGADDGPAVSTTASSSGPVSEEGSAEEVLPSDVAQLDLEEEDAYQARQRGLREEVVELGESIHVKQQLVEQLQRSRHQYEAMKIFYETKLRSLEEEVQHKQREREELAVELHEIAQTEAGQQRGDRERESRLRDDLRKKDDELKSLRKRKDELSNLAQIQTKYVAQAQKLQGDIEAMKKQRVELTRTLQAEKKGHLEALSAKAREIERLKRSLQRASDDAKKNSEARGKAEMRAREALRETAAARKRAMEMMRVGGNSNNNNNNNINNNNSSSTHPLSSVNPAVASKVRMTRQAMTRAHKHGATRALSDEEFKVKQWLDKRIAEISAREHAADTLRLQCEQQLALLSRREQLEGRRVEILGADGDQAGKGSETDISEGAAVGEDEEQRVMQDLLDDIENIDGQLEARHARIADMQRLLDSLEGSSVSCSLDRAIDSLKRTAAQSLPAAHEVIRLLLDMLVQSGRQGKQLKESLAAAKRAHERASRELAAESAKAISATRQGDLELGRVTREYEERLHGLLSHSVGVAFPLAPAPASPDGSSGNSTGSPGRASEGGTPGVPASPSSSLRKMMLGSGTTGRMPWSWSSPSSSRSPSSPSAAASALASTSEKRERGGDQQDVVGAAKVQLLVAAEAVSSLRGQLAREQSRATALQNHVEELDLVRARLTREAQDKDVTIRFLEGECRLFREIADGLKATIKSAAASEAAAVTAPLTSTSSAAATASAASLTIRQACDRALASGLSSSLGVGLLDDDDENEDTASVLDEFDCLAAEISRLGGGGGGSSAGLGALGAGAAGAAGKGVVFSRLTNPDNFTGAMKKVFEQDLVVKRRKVREIKGQLDAPKDRADQRERDQKALGLMGPGPGQGQGQMQGQGQGQGQGRKQGQQVGGERGLGGPRHGLESTEVENIAPSSSAFSEQDDAADDGMPPLPPSQPQQHQQREDIYERLTNPTRFTGIHRREKKGAGDKLEKEVETGPVMPLPPPARELRRGGGQ